MALLMISVMLGLFQRSAFGQSGTRTTQPVVQVERSVDDVLADIGLASRSRLKPFLDRVDQPYPPRRLTLIAIKNSGILEVWAETASKPVYIRSYGILKLSGGSGPKLRVGDEQVPEGIYHIEFLNPNSRFHLSMKLNYPNEFDLSQARREGRYRPGSNIFIHGGSRSIGCLAMGDRTIEELFVLAADTGIENIRVVIAPVDLRQQRYGPSNSRAWVADLYDKLFHEMDHYRPDPQRPDD